MSCPEFGGPHLGPAADLSLVAVVPPADEDEDGDDGDGKDNAVADDDDDEDGAFGDFWRASVRCVVISSIDRTEGQRSERPSVPRNELG